MREFKFRAWDLKLGENSMFYFPNPISIGLALWRISRDPKGYAIMQFTGIIARDKKEVYEHDIIEYRTEDGGAYSTAFKGIVKYDNGAFRCPYELGTIEIFKVLGNIYENPELLKVEIQ